jgi:hypothetical protein
LLESPRARIKRDLSLDPGNVVGKGTDEVASEPGSRIVGMRIGNLNEA